MRYLVTCRKCGGRFQVSTETDAKMNCICPYCSQKLVIILPKEAQASLQNTMQNASHETVPLKKRSSHHGLLWGVLFIIFLILGSAGYLGWTEYQLNLETEQLQARRHHRDSVAQVRMKKESLAMAAQRVEQQQKMICDFLKSFYRKAVLSNADPVLYEHYLSEYCLNTIYGDESTPSDVDKPTAWRGAFGSVSGINNDEELLANLQVIHADGEWYKVRLSQDGATECRMIKVLNRKGQLFIDEVR